MHAGGRFFCIPSFTHSFVMSTPRYVWRQLTSQQQDELLRWRKHQGRPWHWPPHRVATDAGEREFLISAACYEHAPSIGFNLERMEQFSVSLLAAAMEGNAGPGPRAGAGIGANALAGSSAAVRAWCVLPNHYHLLVATTDVALVLKALGQLHGRSSYRWNGEEKWRGRQVFHGAAEREMRSCRHFFATLNYVHHNPVHHGYVERWSDWRWSSASEYVERTGEAEVKRIWKAYPLLGYGATWDAAEV